MGYELKQTATGGLQFWEDLSSAQGSVVLALSANVNRAPTNTTVIGTLPANARITNVGVVVPVVSNAGTTATVSVGLSGGSATAFSAAQDVKGALGKFSATPTVAWTVSTASQILTCTYTESGTASTAGIAYVTVDYLVN